jgi:hypothetical protein
MCWTLFVVGPYYVLQFDTSPASSSLLQGGVECGAHNIIVARTSIASWSYELVSLAVPVNHPSIYPSDQVAFVCVHACSEGYLSPLPSAIRSVDRDHFHISVLLIFFLLTEI